jgi:hypothetical protein
MTYVLGVSRQVVTPSIPGLARDWHFKAFPEFERFYIKISLNALQFVKVTCATVTPFPRATNPS